MSPGATALSHLETDFWGFKLPTSASTEQRMISASVFSTLNEAWDRFKQENGL